MTRFFRLFADNSGVKEISAEEVTALQKHNRKYRFAYVHDTEMALYETRNNVVIHSAWIHRNQLDKIWRTEQ